MSKLEADYVREAASWAEILEAPVLYDERQRAKQRLETLEHQESLDVYKTHGESSYECMVKRSVSNDLQLCFS